jgi:hypothetical protein
VNLDLVLVTLALMAVIVAGVAAIFWVDRWRKRPPEQGSGDELQTFQKLYDQGLLSTEEFERSRGRMQQKGDAPAPSSTAVRPVEPSTPKTESIVPATPTPKPNGPPGSG